MLFDESDPVKGLEKMEHIALITIEKFNFMV